MLLLASILLFQRPKTPQKDNQVQLRPMNGVIFRRLSTFFDTFANHVPRFIRITFVDCLPCYQYITNSYIDWEKCQKVSKIDAIHRTQLHCTLLYLSGFLEAASKMCTRLTNFCWESNLNVLLMYESLFGWLPSTFINNNKNDDVTVVETTTKTWKKGQLQILERSFIIDCQNDAKYIHLSLFDSFLVMHRRQHSEEKLRNKFRYLVSNDF